VEQKISVTEQNAPSRRFPVLKSTVEKWLWFARTLATINSYLLLTILFFLVVVPLGLFYSLTGRAVTRLPSGPTLWTPCSRETDPERPF
jgi:hypothetical protein